MARNKNSLRQDNSRYVAGGTTETLNAKLGWWERNIIPFSADDIVFTISGKYDRRPDLIAYDFLGKAKYSWIILQYNSIVDVETELTHGKIIRIPSRNRLIFEII